MRIELFLPFYFLCAIGICIAHVVLPDSQNVQEKQLLGAKDCTWGTSLECSNLKSKNDEVADNPVCDVCKSIVEVVRKLLIGNSTVQQFIQTWEGRCKTLGDFSSKCIAIVDDYALIFYLEFKADNVCTKILHMCGAKSLSANQDNVLLIPADESPLGNSGVVFKKSKNDEVADNRNCDICKAAVTEVRKLLIDSSTVGQFVQTLEGYCKMLGKYSSKCIEIVDKYAALFYLEFKVDVVCTTILHVCGEKSSFANQDNVLLIRADASPLGNGGVIFKMSKNDEVPDNTECDICKAAVTEVRKLLIGNSTVGQFVQTLEGYCKMLGKYSSKCIEIVDQYAALFYLEFKADVVCTTILHVCGEKSLFANQDNVLLIRADESPLGDSGVIFKIKNGEEPLQQYQSDDNLCSACIKVWEAIQKYLPSFAPKIEKEIEKLCKEFGLLKKECKKIIEKVDSMIIKSITHTLTPKKVCAAIKMCEANSTNVSQDSSYGISERVRLSNSEAMEPLPIERFSLNTLTLMGNTEWCSKCEYFLQQAIAEPAAEVKANCAAICGK